MDIREITRLDEDGVRSLFYLCFNKELTNREWQWKYEESPMGSSAVVAVDNDNIIAHYGGIKMGFYFQGRNFIAFQPCDVMTHPKYRARLFSKRGAMVRAGEFFYKINPMDFAFGFPSERHAILGIKQLGYTEHDYVAVLNKKVDTIKNAWYPLLSIDIGWEHVTGEEIDLFWKDVRDLHGLSIEKNSQYIFWRYRDHPSKRYFPMIIKQRFRKKILVFAVCAIINNRFELVDLLINHQNFKIDSFINILEGYVARKNLREIELWLNPKERISQIFVNKGYKLERGIPLIFKILNKEITASFLFSNYYYRKGDYDSG